MPALDLLRALLPRRCPGCDGQLGREAGLCARCRAGLRPRVEAHSPLSPRAAGHLVTLGEYRGVTRRAVRALKFGGARDLAGALGGALADGVPAAWNVRAVVPVPLHPGRERERGFNQSELLGRAVAASLGVPCVPALRRTRATAQQARLHAAERGTNLAGAFQADTCRLPPGPVLLLDDVMTTGSTLLACRDALHAAGVPQVYCAVVAR
ncbi:competence protein ComF [Deinococcus phoenicis]|uniref:Competence protein ComF n=1 Tax=Deinococcus phoenicis TaxID=1476583 RepID=A0A016QR66_9DEIO|nr:ComF family protein [Deinococcus phoenicis]EYB68274.1 competence protein ComF [Deinococcus phoenicis]